MYIRFNILHLSFTEMLGNLDFLLRKGCVICRELYLISYSDGHVHTQAQFPHLN